MASRLPERHESEIGALMYNQAIESSLANILGFTDLTTGRQIIRDHRGWRANEKEIDYIWITQISRSFVGSIGLITVKFNPNKFRELDNPEGILRCLFTWDSKGLITNFHKEEELYVYSDPIREMTELDLYDANKGMTFGVEYRFKIISKGITTIINLNNPNSETWKKWVQNIWEICKKMSKNSGNIELIEMLE